MILLKNLQPVFIVGTAKSGTTFLYSLFDGHPSALTLLETGAYHAPVVGEGTSPEKLYRYVESKIGHIHADLSSEVLLDSIRSRAAVADGVQARDILELASRAVLLQRSATSKVSHMIEKTPNHYLRVDRILKDFPRAKILHVLRDPRDNYLSLKRRMRDRSSRRYQRANYHPVLFLYDRLLASLNAAYKNVGRYGEDRYRIVFYEGLITGGEQFMRKIASWLDLAWSPTLLQPTKGGETWSGNSFTPELKGELKSFDTRPIGRWKNKLSDREIRLLEWIIDAYHLGAQYRPSLGREVFPAYGSLIMPFQDEVKLEWQKAMQGEAVDVARMVWHYYVRRRSILRVLRDRQRGGDQRIIDRWEAWEG